MGIIRVLKPALFIYECFRIVILAFTLVYTLPGISAVSLLAFSSPQALFPLMALFLMLDVVRYKNYIPLFIAGKCIGMFTLLIWSFIFRNLTVLEGLAGYYVITEFIFLSGDFFALALIILIFRNTQKLENKTELTDIPSTEESSR